jgi:hypothetical protein
LGIHDPAQFFLESIMSLRQDLETLIHSAGDGGSDNSSALDAIKNAIASDSLDRLPAKADGKPDLDQFDGAHPDTIAHLNGSEDDESLVDIARRVGQPEIADHLKDIGVL